VRQENLAVASSCPTYSCTKLFGCDCAIPARVSPRFDLDLNFGSVSGVVLRIWIFEKRVQPDCTPKSPTILVTCPSQNRRMNRRERSTQRRHGIRDCGSNRLPLLPPFPSVTSVAFLQLSAIGQNLRGVREFVVLRVVHFLFSFADYRQEHVGQEYLAVASFCPTYSCTKLFGCGIHVRVPPGFEHSCSEFWICSGFCASDLGFRKTRASRRHAEIVHDSGNFSFTRQNQHSLPRRPENA